MISVFFSAFTPVFLALVKIFLIAVVGGILIRRKIITQSHIESLSKITVIVLLPCLIFSKVLKNFDPDMLYYWWIIPIAGIVMTLVGFGFSALLFIRELPGKNNLLPLASIQNAAYLVLPIGQAVYPEQFDLFAVYVFLIVLGVSPILWSLGKYLNKNESHKKPSIMGFITPPLIANIISILLVLSGTGKYIPPIFTESVDLLGSATIPVVTFVLGATLGSISLKVWPPFFDVIRVMGVKFIILPLITILFIHSLNLDISLSLLVDFFVIQAAAAPATGHILQIRAYGGDIQTAGSIIFISYLVCLLAIPFWIAVSKVIS